MDAITRAVLSSVTDLKGILSKETDMNIKSKFKTEYIFPVDKIKTEINCPKCGKPLWKRVDMILTSNPPKYQYECDCGKIEYHTD